MLELQQIGACAILLNSSGQILLGKRKNGYKAGLYGLPGGRIELNEPIATAIKREVKEETSLEINNLEYLGVIRENQTEYDFIHFVYVAEVGDSKPQLGEPNKCEGWEWFDTQALKTQILPGHLAAIQMFIERKPLTDITTTSK